MISGDRRVKNWADSDTTDADLAGYFPMADTNRTPLFAWHKTHQGRIVDFAGWEMPVQYTGIIAEHEAVRNAVGLFDVSHMGRLEFQGEDAMELLRKATTNDVFELTDNRIQYSLMCDDVGGVIDDVLVYRLNADRWAMVCNASNRDAVLARLHELNSSNARIDDRTESTAMIAVQGPKAVGLVAALVDADAEGIGYYRFRDFLYEGRPSRLSRTGYTGEDGFEWIVAAESAEKAWGKLIEAGAVPCGLGARDTLRLESGMPLYGHELARKIDPFSAGLGKFVRTDRDPFPGIEALKRLQEQPPRRRVGLVVEGKRPARQGSPVLVDGKPVGEVTSGTFSPTLQKAIAMATIDRKIAWPPAEGSLAVDNRGTVVPAAPAKLPFYRRSAV
jgi:aminomethyltransferase